MLTLLDAEVRADAFTYERTAAIVMDLTSVVPALETGSGLGTIW